MFSLPKKKKKSLRDLIEVLTNGTVATISQGINVSKQHFVHLKLTQFYMSIISQ